VRSKGTLAALASMPPQARREEVRLVTISKIEALIPVISLRKTA